MARRATALSPAIRFLDSASSGCMLLLCVDLLDIELLVVETLRPR